MRKPNLVGLVILLLVGLSWAVVRWRQQTGPAATLVEELRDSGLPIEEIEPGEVEDGMQQVVASGPGMRLMVMSFGSPALFRRWMGMMRGSPGGPGAPRGSDTPDPEAMDGALFAREPFIVFAYWTAGDQERAARIERALEGFEKLGGG
jgi:hypothetical protein